MFIQGCFGVWWVSFDDGVFVGCGGGLAVGVVVFLVEISGGMGVVSWRWWHGYGHQLKKGS
jgi:hypothetical protein